MKKFLVTFFLIIFASLLIFYIYPPEKVDRTIRIDKIIVEKSKRKMHIYSKEKCIKTYTISLGKNPVGDKQFEGDKRTPEGKYFIYDKNPHSECYKNLGISYPNAQDRQEAKRLGKKSGGSIKIHGLLNEKGWIGKFHRFKDWTAGCIAVTNEEMEELYQIIEEGTPIIIKP